MDLENEFRIKTNGIDHILTRNDVKSNENSSPPKKSIFLHKCNYIGCNS